MSPSPPGTVRRGDPGYAESLHELEDPPERLWFLGDLSAVEGSPDRLVSIVGTRDASPYGVRVAKALAGAFAQAGVIVVSGMARGIDSAAHEGALGAGGKTVAVLGTGVDVPYPVHNRGLHERVARTGLVLSESEPGTKAFKGCFPRRNRIIAALAKVTIVVEAPFKSGARNTADQADTLGRLVAAVPGPIDSGRSAGSNLLLRDGAQVITSIADALGLYGVSAATTVPKPHLAPADAAVWDALGGGRGTIETIAERAGLPVRQVLESLGRLELAGLAHQLETGEVDRLSAA